MHKYTTHVHTVPSALRYRLVFSELAEYGSSADWLALALPPHVHTKQVSWAECELSNRVKELEQRFTSKADTFLASAAAQRASLAAVTDVDVLRGELAKVAATLPAEARTELEQRLQAQMAQQTFVQERLGEQVPTLSTKPTVALVAVCL